MCARVMTCLLLQVSGRLRLDELQKKLRLRVDLAVLFRGQATVSVQQLCSLIEDFRHGKAFAPDMVNVLSTLIASLNVHHPLPMQPTQRHSIFQEASAATEDVAEAAAAARVAKSGPKHDLLDPVHIKEILNRDDNREALHALQAAEKEKGRVILLLGDTGAGKSATM